MSEWISKMKYVPSSSCSVLCCRKIGDDFRVIKICKYLLLDGSGQFCIYNLYHDEYEPIYDVTHWMPLPDLPEDE